MTTRWTKRRKKMFQHQHDEDEGLDDEIEKSPPMRDRKKFDTEKKDNRELRTVRKSDKQQRANNKQNLRRWI